MTTKPYTPAEQALRDLYPSADEATCGTCGGRFPDVFPSARCPFEDSHLMPADDDLAPTGKTWAEEEATILADAQAAQEYLDAHGPVAPAVTRRTLTLIGEAAQALTQLRYEGSHSDRQDPAPVHGTPWTTPDLPAEVMDALTAAEQALTVLNAVARKAAATQADPDLARR